ncbi:hypothetical protein C8R43DRAFT_898129 [Mycena crocata]|nr:hypothetical protein C8R43DRAFT_898129 [Mycena crocata]
MGTIRTSSSAFLVTSSPIQSTSAPPTFTPFAISPHKQKKMRYARVLAAIPSTVLEEELQESLQEALAQNKQQKSQLISMQSTLVLNGAYCDLVRGQLAAQEEGKKAKKKGRLVGDGMPRLLTSTDFVRRVVAFHDAAAEKEAELSKRKATRAERSEAMAEWKELERVRKEENGKIRARWQADVKAWEAERDRAKQLGKRPSWKKPVLKDQLFSPVPKPHFAGDEPEIPVAGPSNQSQLRTRHQSQGSSDGSSDDSEDEEDELDDDSEA